MSIAKSQKIKEIFNCKFCLHVNFLYFCKTLQNTLLYTHFILQNTLFHHEQDFHVAFLVSTAKSIMERVSRCLCFYGNYSFIILLF